MSDVCAQNPNFTIMLHMLTDTCTFLTDFLYITDKLELLLVHYCITQLGRSKS